MKQGKRFSIAFPTRELWPFVVGGGIGRVLHGAIRLLAGEAEVTVITRDAYRKDYERMRAAGDPRLPHPDVRFEFIRDADGFGLGAFSSSHHCWSGLVFEKLRELYPDGGPDLVEFNDYLGEGFVTLQARRSGHASMHRTKVLIRLHTTLEMVDALNGRADPDEERRSIYTLERGSVAFADALLSPGGDVLASYERFYGSSRVAPGLVLPHVISTDGAPPPRAAPEGGPTRLLLIGRLERRKGVQELVEAVHRLDRDDFRLTVLGADTDSAPGGGSMREVLKGMVGQDERVVFHDAVPLDRVLELIDEHHVVVIPSPWEAWSAVARESLSRNRPVLATPRGGLTEAVRPGASGWLAAGSTTDDLERALRALLDSREEIDTLIAGGRPAEHLRDVMRPEVTLDHYRRLAAHEPEPEQPAPTGSVSAVVACSAGTGPLERTLRSLAKQQRPVNEVLLVFDGVERLPSGLSPLVVDRVELLDAGAGLQACRNVGCELATGDLILLLDAGTELDPPHVERLAASLQRAPDAAYATAWSRDLDPSAVPLGNFSNLVTEHDNAAVAPLIRREVFERGHRFDASGRPCAGRTLYARLGEEGWFGRVVPERLLSGAPFSAGCGSEPLIVPTDLASWIAGDDPNPLAAT